MQKPGQAEHNKRHRGVGEAVVDQNQHTKMDWQYQATRRVTVHVMSPRLRQVACFLCDPCLPPQWRVGLHAVGWLACCEFACCGWCGARVGAECAWVGDGGLGGTVVAGGGVAGAEG